MNRAYYIRTLLDEAYEGENQFRHKAAGAALGLGGIGIAALAGHALAKGQSFGQSAGDLYHHVSHLFTTPSAHASTSQNKTAAVVRGARRVSRYAKKIATAQQNLRMHSLETKF